MDNWETGLPKESLCARCGRNIQEVKCSAEVHGPNSCRFECSFCGFTNSGPDDQCMRELHLTVGISTQASETVSLPDEVNRLIGEIVTNFALAENNFNKLLPEQFRGTRPFLSNDIKVMRRLLSSIEPKFLDAVQRIIDLAEDISPVRHNLAHGQMIMRASHETTPFCRRREEL